MHRTSGKYGELNLGVIEKKPQARTYCILDAIQFINDSKRLWGDCMIVFNFELDFYIFSLTSTFSAA